MTTTTTTHHTTTTRNRSGRASGRTDVPHTTRSKRETQQAQADANRRNHTTQPLTGCSLTRLPLPLPASHGPTLGDPQPSLSTPGNAGCGAQLGFLLMLPG